MSDDLTWRVAAAERRDALRDAQDEAAAETVFAILTRQQDKRELRLSREDTP